MKVLYFKGVEEFISSLNDDDRGRIVRTAKFFEESAFSIGPKYIKKISKIGIWELRSGKVRLFLYIKGKDAICVHAIYKKSQKLKSNDIKLAEKRSKEL